MGSIQGNDAGKYQTMKLHIYGNLARPLHFQPQIIKQKLQLQAIRVVGSTIESFFLFFSFWKLGRMLCSGWLLRKNQTTIVEIILEIVKEN